MKHVYESMEALIGNTPLLHLNRIEKKYGCRAEIYAKLESRNPAGSAKDRAALSMLDAALREGRLVPGGTVIEPTSGNTGIGLSAIAAARGYKMIVVMPDTMSKERILLMQAYGAKVVLTPGAKGMAGAIAEAERIASETPGSVIAGQFVNPANPEAHYRTTGPEIYEDMEGDVDIFVSGIGTGGTISGIGRYLKEQNKSIRVVGVEPLSSPFLTEGKSGPHKIQGIGAGFIPAILDKSAYDEVVTVSNEDAYTAGREFGRTEGVLIGISGGAALFAALTLAKKPENAGKKIVVLFPDGGDHYLSTPGYYDV